MIDVKKIKKDFPVFEKYPNLVYLDSAATSFKPASVIEKIVEYYQEYSANIHRGIYQISERATKEYEETRAVVAKFIGAESSEIVFTKNTTEALNILAFGLAEKFLKRGDEILISIAEHHSNFVPWQIVCQRKKANLKILDVNEEGRLKIDDLKKLITKKTRIVSLSFVSNVLGTVNPVKKISQIIKNKNQKIIFVLDAAQAVPHLKINVKNLGCDFLAFSGHKMLGPTGVGVLWGKKEILKEILPLNFGGGMILNVKIKKTTFQEPPFSFEAGTPDIGSIVAFKEAIFYLEKIGLKNIQSHSFKLTNLVLSKLKEEFGPKIKILGPKDPKERIGVIAFNFGKIHPHDLSQLLDRDNICLRAGYHCAMPLHKRFKVKATARASFYLYNQKEDTEKLILGLKKIERILKI